MTKKLIIASIMSIAMIAVSFSATEIAKTKLENDELALELQMTNDELERYVVKVDETIKENEELEKAVESIDEKLEEIDSLKTEMELAMVEMGAEVATEPEEASYTSRSAIARSEDYDVDITEILMEQEETFNELKESALETIDQAMSYPNLYPAEGRFTSGFGYRRHPVSGTYSFHKGVDIANSTGTEIMAAGSGVVTFAGYNGGYGYIIVIDHGNGYQTVYAHNSKMLVSAGDVVEKGQVISKMGSTGTATGSHLHFEIHKDGVQIDPMTIIEK